ncbi:MAG: tRNA (adenosine(37)-N6)-threonylcarbamoyltransferase complex dimerization subunit type 1 TsaB [Pseudomonadota bacterium]
MDTTTASLLAFDTSTEHLSVALSHHGRVFTRDGAGGAQSSTTLIPAVQAVLADAGIGFGQLDAIVFGRGPGSFTGLRTATAAAQGMAYGGRPGGLPVLPVDTLLAVAEEARVLHGAERVVAALDARMDEVYFCAYAWDTVRGAWQAEGDFGLGKPESVAVPPGWTLAGTARAAYGERIAPQAPAVAALPTATALLRLAPALVAAGGLLPAAEALPLYIRDKVAKTVAERLMERNAAVAAALETLA